MAKSLSLFVAKRYISQKQNKGFSSFISASSTVGIAIGVAILILVLSAMNGFERALAQNLLSVVPHVELVSVKEPVNNWPTQLKKVVRHKEVVAAAPVIKMQGMLQYKDKLKGLEVRGVDAKLETNVSALSDYMSSGRWQHLSKENAIIIGQTVADKLNVKVGDSLQLLLPPMSNDNQVNQRFNAMKKRNVTVVGIYKFGGEIDGLQAFISHENAQRIMNYQAHQTQALRLSVNQVFDAPRIAREVAYQVDSYVYIYDWTFSQGHLYNDIQLVRMVMFIVLVLVIAVASFNIVSTLIMAVNEKQSDIAILKTMGAKSSTIMCIFMFQGLRNGVVGTFLGSIIGTLLATYLTDIAIEVELLLGTKFLSADVYFIDFLPTHVQSSDIVITIITALTLTLAATLYPAWRATKVEPAQVLGQA